MKINIDKEINSLRLQKFMANCGVASRRKSEEIIVAGRVSVNGVLVRELGLKVDERKDIVSVDGKIIKSEENKLYILLNKPIGYITTVSDQFGRKTVIDLVREVSERVYPVGRLDYDTSGLLLLTNDGDLAYKITHPKYEITKKYIARVSGVPKESDLQRFRDGLQIEDYITSKAKIKIITVDNGEALLEVVIHEGRNRQVRKMCSKIGHPVIELKRVEVGKIKLGNVREGRWRYLTEEEVNFLKS